MLKTAFWINAANSLPAAVRQRYMRDFERAERWELALNAAIEACSRALNYRLPRRPGESEASSSSSG